MGGPNVLRGRSHSGNVSAGELAALGLVTALASDYLPSSLLGAAFSLADGCMTLPAAVSLVTSGPATAVGLADRVPEHRSARRPRPRLVRARSPGDPRGPARILNSRPHAIGVGPVS